MRLLSSMAVSAYICACAVTLRTILFADDGGSVSFLLYIFSVGLAYTLGNLLLDYPRNMPSRLSQTKAVRFIVFMLDIKNIDRTLAASTTWFMLVIPAAAALVIYRQHDILRILFELSVLMTAYIVSLKYSKKAPTKILTDSKLYTGLFILTVCLELPYLNDRLLHLRPWHFGALYLLIFAYLVVKNQEDIDNNIYEKKHIEKSVLPGNLRRFNTFMICIVFLFIMLLFNLKPVVIWLLNLAKRIIGIVISAILWLMEQILPDAGQVEGGMSAAPQLPPDMGVQPPTPLWDLFFNVLKNFILLYLAYRLILLIVSKIPVIASKVAGWIKRLFEIRRANTPQQESDYVDITETVLPERAAVIKNTKSKKRTIKALRKITDPVQRVRYMYGLILDMLAMRGINPRPADTTSEIADKAHTAVSDGFRAGLPPFTAIYERVRYGETQPDNETLARAQAYFGRLCGTEPSGKGEV